MNEMSKTSATVILSILLVCAMVVGYAVGRHIERMKHGATLEMPR